MLSKGMARIEESKVTPSAVSMLIYMLFNELCI